MNLDIDNISAVVAVLGAYFAILLVLSVSVETILEPFSFFKGLRKPVNPDDVLNSIQEWLPSESSEAAKVIAIQRYAAKTKTNLTELENRAKKLIADAEGTLGELGLQKQAQDARTWVAIELAALREQYAASQRQRITLLRLISALIGIGIAFALDINTFQILGSLFSEQVTQSLATPLGHYGGIVITGLAASAGSSFWHDMIGRARNIKETIKQVEGMAKG